MGDAYETMRTRLEAERDGLKMALEASVKSGARVVKQRDEARLALAEISELVGPGGDGTPFGRVESMLSTLRASLERVTSERDEARSEEHGAATERDVAHHVLTAVARRFAPQDTIYNGETLCEAIDERIAAARVEGVRPYAKVVDAARAWDAALRREEDARGYLSRYQHETEAVSAAIAAQEQTIATLHHLRSVLAGLAPESEPKASEATRFAVGARVEVRLDCALDRPESWDPATIEESPCEHGYVVAWDVPEGSDWGGAFWADAARVRGRAAGRGAPHGVPDSCLAGPVRAGDTPEQVAAWFEVPVEDVLTAVQRAGIVHRDLKPGNQGAPPPPPDEEWGTDDESADYTKSAPNTVVSHDPGCTCETQNTAYLGNPHGHNVMCPAWGTQIPNRTAPLPSETSRRDRVRGAETQPAPKEDDDG